MHTIGLVIRIVNAVLFVVLGVAALRQWRRHKDAAAAWVAATFCSIGMIAAIGLFLPQGQAAHGALSWVVKSLLVILSLFPYCLHRFAAVFELRNTLVNRIVTALTGAVIAGSLALPHFPSAAGPRPWWFLAYVWLFLLQWTAVSVVVLTRLWRAGRGQATVARRRMRMLSIATGLLDVSLLLSAFLPSTDQHSAARLGTGLLTTVSCICFFLGFAPPALLRQIWRRGAEHALQRAQLELMTASTRGQVLDLLLPHGVGVLSGRSGAFVDVAGTVITAVGMTPDAAQRETLGALRLPMAAGTLLVWASPHTPYFGREEIELLRSFGLVADLALARCELVERERDTSERLAAANDDLQAAFQREREGRLHLERANADLETFVYSVSHDLKSPMISFLGYLEYLKVDLGGDLPQDIRHYLDRMTVSGNYMQALIHDLLELSRVGRSQTDVESVDLRDLLSDVADEVGSLHPGAVIEIEAMPVVRMNPVRARQLLTNLVGNAADHAGRSDVRIHVEASTEPNGGVELTVTDDGPGIAPAYREKVFGVFERLEPQRDQSGTGIGLAICRRIVEAAGGKIEVADAEIGTRMIVHLPAAMIDVQPSDRQLVLGPA